MKLHDFRITLNDVTSYCSNIPNGIDKIYEVIMFNPNMKTHLCSLTPSQDYVLLWHTYTVTDSYYELSDEDKELVWDYELTLQNDDSPWYDYFDKITTPSIPIPDWVWDEFFDDFDGDIFHSWGNYGMNVNDAVESLWGDNHEEIVASLNGDIDVKLKMTVSGTAYRDGEFVKYEFEVDVWFEVIRTLRNFLLDWNSTDEISIVIEDGEIKSFN